MGFEIETVEPRATILLDEPQFAGVEIDVCVLLSASYYFALRQWADQSGAADAESPGDNAKALRAEVELFMEYGRPTWNLLRRGEPIPVTTEEMLRLPPALVRSLIGTWTSAVGTVPLPLPGGSATGPESQAPVEMKPTRSRRSTSRAAGRSTTSTAPTSAG